MLCFKISLLLFKYMGINMYLIQTWSPACPFVCVIHSLFSPLLLSSGSRGHRVLQVNTHIKKGKFLIAFKTWRGKRSQIFTPANTSLKR